MKFSYPTLKNLFILTLLFVQLASCKKDGEEKINTIPEFYTEALESNYGKNNPDFKIIADSTSLIQLPQDLDFNPLRQNELWIINKRTGYAGGVIIISNAGKDNQASEQRVDGNAMHFMNTPSGISFSENGNFATSTAFGGATFMGPTLWSSDLNIFGKPSGGNGSHIDMLHGSPFCMGISNDNENAFWVYDGYNKHIVYYDFAHDHGPGNDDHSDGKIHRYTEVSLTKMDNIPSHIVLDKKSGWLYICDAGNNRILRMNTRSGSKKQDLPELNEPLAEHWEMKDVQWEVFANSGFSQPAGIEIKDDRLFVSDFATGEIIVYNTSSKSEIGRLKTGHAGVLGLKIGYDGKLWFVNQATNKVIRIDPK